jgi:DNA repair protein RadA
MIEIVPIEDVKFKGVGDEKLEKLKKAKLNTVNALAILTEIELVSYTGFTIELAQSIIQQARDIICPGFITAEDLASRQVQQELLHTGSKQLNRILGGGIHPQAITEFISEFGGGKTQICVTAAVIAASQGKNVAVIDTEGTFLPERIDQIAKGRGYDPIEIKKRIRIARAYTAEHLHELTKHLPTLISDFNIQLIILDSIITHFRSEYLGLGNLATRQQKLAEIIHALQRASDGFGIPVIVTNQVQTKVGVMFGDPNQGAGGHIMAHGGTYRVMLRKGSMEKTTGYRTILAQVIDASWLPEEKVRIMISAAGIVDEDGGMSEKMEEKEDA